MKKDEKATSYEDEHKTYFFRNFLWHIGHSNNCSCRGDDEVFLFRRLAVDCGFFGAILFKCIRWICSLRFAFRVNFRSH